MKSEKLKKLAKHKCEVCGKKATSIIRTVFVCSQCFGLIQKDNIKLFNKGLDIPATIIIEKNCFRYKCTNKIIGKITYLPEYCSKECKEIDKRIKEDAYKLMERPKIKT